MLEAGVRREVADISDSSVLGACFGEHHFDASRTENSENERELCDGLLMRFMCPGRSGWLE